MPQLFKPPVPDTAHPLVCWNQLYGSSAALALAEAAAADARPWVLVEPDSRSLERRRAELEFFAPAGLRLLSLPDWEVLPYDLFSPHPDIVSERLLTLAELPDWRRGILLVTRRHAAAAPAAAQLRRGPQLHAGGRRHARARGIPRAPGRGRLRQRRRRSARPGEFALRGSLLDVFPMGTETPLRIDLFDDQIEAIRRFDPQTQRSGATLQSVRLLPAREIPLDADAVRAFRRRSHALRGRSDTQPRLSRRQRRHRAAGHRVLPAAVLRRAPRRCSTTCPADACSPTAPSAAGARRRLGRHRAAPRGAAPRHRTAAARAGRAVRRAARGCARASRASRASRSRISRSSRRTSAGVVATSPPRRRASSGSMRAPKAARAAEAFLAEYPGPRAARRGLARPARSAGELLRGAGIGRPRRGWREFLAGSARLALTIAPDSPASPAATRRSLCCRVAAVRHARAPGAPASQGRGGPERDPARPAEP
jgi:hypothetical protein